MPSPRGPRRGATLVGGEEPGALAVEVAGLIVGVENGTGLADVDDAAIGQRHLRVGAAELGQRLAHERRQIADIALPEPLQGGDAESPSGLQARLDG